MPQHTSIVFLHTALLQWPRKLPSYFARVHVSTHKHNVIPSLHLHESSHVRRLLVVYSGYFRNRNEFLSRSSKNDQMEYQLLSRTSKNEKPCSRCLLHLRCILCQALNAVVLSRWILGKRCAPPGVTHFRFCASYKE